MQSKEVGIQMQDELLKVTTEMQTVSLSIIDIRTIRIMMKRSGDALWSLPNVTYVLLKALKTYNLYHTDCLIAEGKLKEAERLEERHTGKSAELGPGQLGGQRRSSVKKMERLMEKVSVCVCVLQEVSNRIPPPTEQTLSCSCLSVNAHLLSRVLTLTCVCLHRGTAECRRTS